MIAERDGLRVIDEGGWAHLETPIPIDYIFNFWETEHPGALEQALAQKPWLDRMYGIWLSELASLTRGRSLVDVGSGYGLFVDQALRSDWSAFGLELSESASEYAETIQPGRTICTNWEQWSGTWDVITAMWLVEHLTNPVEFLAWAEQNLAPNGVLMLVVPNEWTELQRQASEKAVVKNWWIHRTHYSYFSWATLEALLARVGFSIVQRMGTFAMEKFILGGWDYTNDPERGRKAHENIERLETAMGPAKLRLFYATLGEAGEGRDVVAFCKRSHEA